MKLSSLFSLLLLALPSTMALRGAAKNQPRTLLEEQDVTDRDLGGGGNYGGYTKYNGACRKYSSGTGGGNHGDEFYRYKKSDYHDLSYDWCYDKCKDKGDDCTGFEYRDAGDNSHCEVWKYHIKGYDKHKDDHYCYVKGGIPDDGDDDTPDEPEGGGNYGGYTKYHGACRKYSNGTGKGDHGDEFYRYKKSHYDDLSYDWCYNKCKNKSGCTGWEYRDAGSKSHCEVWTYTIGGYDKHQKDHYCYVKK